MKNMTIRRIAFACGGILNGRADWMDREIEAITTDSRQAGEGSLFAAIKGERADGHSFIPTVFEQGAWCVITEQELPAETPGCWIRVPSTLQALKGIAEYYLEQLQIPVVGVTGSVGKTSTKEMIAAVLSQKYRTLKTQGNFNNELGLPLTVFRLREEDEIAVLEMGISDFGEMHRLAKVARPDTCVITNIGQCHLEFLHDRNGILRAKTEIFDYLDESGHIILNGNDDKLAGIREVNHVKPVFFGIPGETSAYEEEETVYPELDIWADEICTQGLKGTSCRIHTKEGSFGVLIPIPGRHMVSNALAGTAVGLTYGMTPEEIKKGIESLQPVSGRFHIIETGKLTVIDDCYNANPVSMKASLEVLKDGLGRKVAILGDMAELGEREVLLHEEVGSFAGVCGIDKLICVGPLCANLAAKAKETDPKLQTVHFETLDELLQVLDRELAEGDTVLVKASHCMGFSGIVEQLSRKAEEK